MNQTIKKMFGGLLALGLALSAEAYQLGVDNTARTGTGNALVYLPSDYGGYRYKFTPAATGWYYFYSYDNGYTSSDPFVMVATGTAAESYITQYGCLKGDAASTMSDLIVYDDDGGGNRHFAAYAYLYSGSTYYVYASLYSAYAGTAGYQIVFYSYAGEGRPSDGRRLPELGSGTISNTGSATVSLSNQKPVFRYAFTAPYDGTFRAYSDEKSTSPSVDPYVVVASASESNVYNYILNNGKGGGVSSSYSDYVIHDDDGNGNNNFSASFTMTQGQTYYVFATRYGINRTGSYKLHVASTHGVTLNAQGGTGGTTGVTATYGAAMPSATMPTKAGSEFIGYFDAPTGGTKYYNADGTSARAWDKTSSSPTTL